MDTPNWGLGNWDQDTTTEADGAFFKRNLQGAPVGLTQGAFRGVGAALQGAGAGLMGQHRPLAEMGLLGFAAGANRMQREQGAPGNYPLGAFRPFQGDPLPTPQSMQPGGGADILSRAGPQGAEMRKNLTRPPLFNENMATQAESAGANHMFRGGFAAPWQR